VAIHDLIYLTVLMSCQLASQESDEPCFSFPLHFGQYSQLEISRKAIKLIFSVTFPQ